MNETLEIKKSDAIKAHDNCKRGGKKLLENLFGKNIFQKEITDRIKTFDDVLKELGIRPTLFSGDCLGLTKDEIAYKKLKLIVKAFNEGWLPDWTNSSEYKYYAWFKMGSSSGGFSFSGCDVWDSGSAVGSRLCFKNSTLAKYAGTQFEDIYKQFLTI